MDDVDQNVRPRRTRVLRAADVIPPFDRISGQAEVDQADPVQNQPPESETGEGEGSSQNDLSADAGRSDAGENAMEPPSAVGGDIPKYDLAENILAEQRRVASRRRRAPTQVEEKPAAPPERGEAVPSLPETPSEDLPELQRIVAEIVAKDIDRLCRRPER